MTHRPANPSDPLTYRYPRTWAEAISRFPCAGDEAVAIERHRQPLHRRLVFALADFGAALILGAGLTALALEYFGVLTQ